MAKVETLRATLDAACVALRAARIKATKRGTKRNLAALAIAAEACDRAAEAYAAEVENLKRRERVLLARDERRTVKRAEMISLRSAVLARLALNRATAGAQLELFA